MLKLESIIASIMCAQITQKKKKKTGEKNKMRKKEIKLFFSVPNGPCTNRQQWCSRSGGFRCQKAQYTVRDKIKTT
jgi:hypothetical protein